MQPSSDTRDPVAVWIFGRHPLPESLIEPILWGLEEEGIPGETRSTDPASADAMAKLAADASPLNVGIGVSEARREVALHHRDLPASQPLFVLGATDLAPTPLRRLGANAARLVKGDPLAMGDEQTTVSEPVATTDLPRDVGPTETSRDLVERISTLVVARLLGDGSWRQQQPTTNDAPRRRPA